MLRLPRAVERWTGDTASQDVGRTALENRGRNRGGVDEMMQAQKEQTLIQLARRRRQAYSMY